MASKEKICITNVGLIVSVIYFGLACKTSSVFWEEYLRWKRACTKSIWTCSCIL